MIGLRPGTSRLLLVIVYFTLLTVVGAIGYMAVEGWSWRDALYMTAITLTAVGFHEVHPLTEGGRYWTMGLLAGGLTGLGMWFALVTSFVVRMDIGNAYKRRKTMQKINRIKGHMIVCGGGRMGRQVMQELDGAKKPHVLIEQDRTTIESLRKTQPDALIIHDDATQDRVLREAGIEKAAGLVSCLSSDTDNLFVCLSARHLNRDLVVVARAEGKPATAKMYRAGADHVVSPNVTGAIRVASVLARPAIASFLDIAVPGGQRSRRLEQATVGAKSKVAGRTLADADLPSKTGMIIIAIRKRGAEPGEIIFNPNASTLLNAGDDVIVMGSDDQIRSLREYLS